MNIEHQYLDLLRDILENGVEKNDRTGTGTISVFGRQIRHKMSEGYPLLTTKKMAFKTMATELLWFLKGDTNIRYLVDNDCNIWNGDCFSHYQKEFKKLHYHTAQMGKEEFINKIKTDDEFAKKWGELGSVYGRQWRSWKRYRKVEDVEHKETLHIIDYIDQIANLINDLKTNPDSRRLMVNAWNVGELDQMVLPPCHYGFQVYTRELSLEERLELIQPYGMDALKPEAREKWMEENNVPTRAISLMWNQRSVDTFLGLPFNIASYALILLMIADEVNMVPEELIGNFGDVHLYKNHIEQAKEQLTREPMKLPTVHVRDGIFCSSIDDIILENYQSHPAIKAPLSN